MSFDHTDDFVERFGGVVAIFPIDTQSPSMNAASPLHELCIKFMPHAARDTLERLAAPNGGVGFYRSHTFSALTTALMGRIFLSG